ncbi:MAG: 4Fe-4S ferredoxin [Desulfobulbaceae bacterium A2]|nr:MAG: 4Fe-4S ferredoxin [Desulfobulbaceae bacterium A2]
MPTAKDIFIRLERCVACHSCEIACAVEHSASKHLFAALFEPVRPRKRLHVEAAGDRNVPVVCRHCEDAPCAAICPTGATYRDAASGKVLQRPEKCIGCLLCVQACPFGMMGQRAESRIAIKCDHCPERTQPACVAACPTKALLYTDTVDFNQARRRAVAASLAAGAGGEAA